MMRHILRHAKTRRDTDMPKAARAVRPFKIGARYVVRITDFDTLRQGCSRCGARGVLDADKHLSLVRYFRVLPNGAHKFEPGMWCGAGCRQRVTKPFTVTTYNGVDDRPRMMTVAKFKDARLMARTASVDAVATVTYRDATHHPHAIVYVAGRKAFDSRCD